MTNIDKSKFEFVELDSSASEVIDTPTYSYWKSVFRQFFSKKSTIAMLILLIAILLMSFIYPMFSMMSVILTIFQNAMFGQIVSIGLVRIRMVSRCLMVFGTVLEILY